MSFYSKPVPDKIVCDCANNSVGRFHKAGQSPCQMLTADWKARYWVVGIGIAGRYDPMTRESYPIGRYAYVFRSYNTLRGANKLLNRTHYDSLTPIAWSDMVWKGSGGYQIVENPYREQYIKV